MVGIAFLIAALWGSVAASSPAPADPGSPASAPADVESAAIDGEARRTFNILPAIFYTPETGFGGGAGLIFTMRPARDAPAGEISGAQRPSSLGALAIYTEKHQTNLIVSPDVYLAHGAWRIAGDVGYTKFPSTIYGIGRNTPEEAGEDYTAESGSLSGRLLHRPVAGLSVGLNLACEHTAIVRGEPGGIVDRRKADGREDGWLVGFGPALHWDTRDNVFAPERGVLCQLGSVYYTAALGSDFAVDTHGIDLRGYYPLAARHVLAVQAVWRKAGGRVPLRAYPTLGNHLRGIVEGRYQDRILTATQVEYRFPLLWRLRGNAFLAAGALAEDWTALDLGAGRISGGAGVRYVLNREERLYLRFDLGVAAGGAEVYFQFGEAF